MHRRIRANTHVHSIQHGNIVDSGFQCTTLSMIDRKEKKVGAAYRIFDRESIEKVCRFTYQKKKILCYVFKLR